MLDALGIEVYPILADRHYGVDMGSPLFRLILALYLKQVKKAREAGVTR